MREAQLSTTFRRSTSFSGAPKWALMGFLSVASFSAPARAFQAETTPPGEAAKKVDATASLAERQAVIRDRVNRLEDRMYQLAETLKKTEPEKADRLMQGLSRLRSEQVRERMAQIVLRLQDERLSDAAEQQQQVMEDLQSLLRQLLDDPDHLGERKTEIERLDAIRKTLQSLIEEQERELRAAMEARALARRAQAMEEAARKVRELQEKQADLAEQTKNSEDLSGEAKAQAEIRGETEPVARNVSELKDVAPEDAGPASNALNDALQAMEHAERSLRESDRSTAEAAQKQAAAALEAAGKALEEKVAETRRKLSLQKQAEEQSATAEKTKQLGRQMQPEDASQSPGDSSQKSGENQENESGKSKEGESSELPGQKNVQDAVPYQNDAARELEKENAEKAVEKQEKAIEKMKKAQEELEDRLEQLRKEQQEEFLAALESRFRAMLSRQLECNKITSRLGALDPDEWKRADQLELADVATRQRWVGDQADDALFLLKEEGTTVILPQLIRQVRDDSRESAERLAAADAGEAVRALQGDIEQVLRDIIEAIERKQEEMEGEQESGSEGSEGNSPLLPGSAELKLLRSCQLRVNKATQQLHQDRTKDDANHDELNKRLQKLSERQADVAEMAKQMHESLRRAQ